jgi:hypothetical protein
VVLRSEKLVAETGDPDKGGRPLLIAATKLRLVKTEKTVTCAVITVMFGVCISVRLS